MPRFLSSAAAALQREPTELEVVDLAATDDCWARFRQKWTAVREGRVAVRFVSEEVTSDRAQARRWLDEVAVHLPDVLIYLHLSLSPWCGAIESRTSEILRSVLDLVQLDQEDVFACDVEARVGLVVEYVTDHLPSSGPQANYWLLAWNE
jgi:hypothetical protein